MKSSIEDSFALRENDEKRINLEKRFGELPGKLAIELRRLLNSGYSQEIFFMLEEDGLAVQRGGNFVTTVENYSKRLSRLKTGSCSAPRFSDEDWSGVSLIAEMAEELMALLDVILEHEQQSDEWMAVKRHAILNVMQAVIKKAQNNGIKPNSKRTIRETFFQQTT